MWNISVKVVKFVSREKSHQRGSLLFKFLISEFLLKEYLLKEMDILGSLPTFSSGNKVFVSNYGLFY